MDRPSVAEQKARLFTRQIRRRSWRLQSGLLTPTSKVGPSNSRNNTTQITKTTEMTSETGSEKLLTIASEEQTNTNGLKTV